MQQEDFPRRRKLADASQLIASIPDPVPEQPAAQVTLARPMLSYACNLQGCCCRGWRIGLVPHDLVRLGRALPPAEQHRITKDIDVFEELSPEGTPTVTQAYAVGEETRCRFLAEDLKCDVHARAGVEALPDVCVDFPVSAYATPAGAEFYYDPVCPSVLDALASGASTTAATLQGPFEDGSLNRRASHLQKFPAVRIGETEITPDQLLGIRERASASLQDHGRSPLEHLLAIDSAYAEVGLGERSPAEFSLRYDRSPSAYRRFFRECLRAHDVEMLTSVAERYERFVFSIPRDPKKAAWSELEEHIAGWEAAASRWLDADAPGLRELQLRYLAYRHFEPFVLVRGKLRFASGAIVHLFATALRYAAAYGAVLRRPVDPDILKAALGTAEFAYRSPDMPVHALRWFGLPATPVG